ncbi:MAG: S8 family serine peptidase [Candidatus Solibacter usitatus]|nr:S8 family serine peptidase [Candidatus Solibacter usitatus]
MRLLLVALLAAAAFGQEIVPGQYIVELTGDPAIRHREPGRRRVEIQDQHQALERQLRGRRASVLARMDTVVNAVVVEAADASALAGLAGVRRVEPVRMFRPFLYRALPSHQVDKAWEMIGGSANAGAGIKIGILDTGLDVGHPAFNAPGMKAPEGYPLASSEENRALTSGKVIVARSFDGGTIQDMMGHGTGVAMAAAGVVHTSPRGTLSGVAPAAWLGVYRVADLLGKFYSSTVLSALDWAAKDGMDVLNFSFGSVGAFGASNDSIFQDGVKRLVDSGVIVVNAAGNTPGAMTVDDTASAEQVIAVGANAQAQTTVAVVPSVGPSMAAAASSNVVTLEPVSGPMVDAAAMGNPLGCSPFPPESLRGRIPLIQRGTCNFSVKLANASIGGAAAAVVYNEAAPFKGGPEDLVTMLVDEDPSIPGLFVGYTNGTKLKDLIATVEDFQVQLRFPMGGGKPTQLAWFSSEGPSVELAIKPDLVATGMSFYTAALRNTSSTICIVCDASGYSTTQGTSFSSPVVAGAAALLRAARPGLTQGEYRSLLINSAMPLIFPDGGVSPVQWAGAGILNVNAALKSTVAAAPVSVSFGAGGGTVDLTREIKLKNLGREAATWALSISSTSAARPALSAESVAVEPGAEAAVRLSLASGGLEAGEYEGFVIVKDDSAGIESRIPYWYGVGSTEPSSIVVIEEPDKPRAGFSYNVYVRIHDKAGLALAEPQPTVTPVSGGGAVVSVRSAFRDYPNSYLLRLQMGSRAGANVFRVEAGSAQLTYTLITEN